MTQLVYLSPVPSASMMQRPHFFVQQARQNGISSVLWVEPSPSRLPQISDLFQQRKAAREPLRRPRDTKIATLPTQLLPLEPLPIIGTLANASRMKEVINKIKAFSQKAPTIFIAGKPTQLALELARNKNLWATSVYDAMDDFPAFFTGRTQANVTQLERALVEQVDHLFCSSEPLQTKFSKQSKLLLNACSSNLKDELNILKKPDHPTPVFGYIGTLAKWFDWDILNQLAKTFSHCRIEITGPQKTLPPRSLKDNIHLNPAVSNDEIPKVLRSFDIGLIPFKLNQLTASVDPIKYYEYCAAGIPVISTRFGQMANRSINDNTLFFDQIIESRELPETQLLHTQCGTETPDWGKRFNPALFEMITSAV